MDWRGIVFRRIRCSKCPLVAVVCARVGSSTLPCTDWLLTVSWSCYLISYQYSLWLLLSLNRMVNENGRRGCAPLAPFVSQVIMCCFQAPSSKTTSVHQKALARTRRKFALRVCTPSEMTKLYLMTCQTSCILVHDVPIRLCGIGRI